MNSIKRSTPLAAIAATLALSVPLPSFAASDEIEEVVVTGSRIARDSNLTGAQPIQGVSSEDIAESGEFALMDVVNDIPALIGSLSQEMSIDSGFADGANLSICAIWASIEPLHWLTVGVTSAASKGVRRLILALFPSNWSSESKCSREAHPQSMVQMR